MGTNCRSNQGMIVIECDSGVSGLAVLELNPGLAAEEGRLPVRAHATSNENPL
jgi:hypothetical protein